MNADNQETQTDLLKAGAALIGAASMFFVVILIEITIWSLIVFALGNLTADLDLNFNEVIAAGALAALLTATARGE